MSSKGRGIKIAPLVRICGQACNVIGQGETPAGIPVIVVEGQSHADWRRVQVAALGGVAGGNHGNC